MKKLSLVFVIAALSLPTFAASKKPKTLEEKLDSLNLPVNEGPASIAKEKLYSVQRRLSPLTNRHEVTFDMGTNLNVDGHLRSQQLGGAYHYHFNDKWSIGFGGYKVFNELTEPGRNLLERDFIAPNKDFAKHQFEAFASYNLFYGKFRIGADNIYYFDQYITLAGGSIGLSSGSSPLFAPEVGIALWLGKNASVRAGVRNEFYEEVTVIGTEINHNVLAYLKIGYLFGDR